MRPFQGLTLGALELLSEALEEKRSRLPRGSGIYNLAGDLIDMVEREIHTA